MANTISSDKSNLSFLQSPSSVYRQKNISHRGKILQRINSIRTYRSRNNRYQFYTTNQIVILPQIHEKVLATELTSINKLKEMKKESMNLWIYPLSSNITKHEFLKICF
jgi:hypothetical protein